MTRVAVAPSKFARGLDATGRRVSADYEVLDLTDALTRIYPTDAHLVTYVIPGATHQPRINKPGLAFAPAIPEVGVLFCDVDNAEHAEWTDALMARAREEDDSLPVLASAGVYYTLHGRRIVQPLATPIAVSAVEAYLVRWLRDLENAGIAVDWACRDWTRHFRLPHVWRSRRAYRSPRVALDRMRPIVLASIPFVAEPTESVAAGERPTPRALPNVDWTHDVPPSWQPKVARIAKAVGAVDSEWHSLFLALAGGLLARGVPPEHLPALCRAISLATLIDTRTGDREASARSTVQRKLSGQRVSGFAELRRRYRGVADAIDEVLASGAEARVRAHARETASLTIPPLSETMTALDAAIRDAPDGLTLISAECGLGKTQSAIRVATERAGRRHAHAGVVGARAPLQSKTAISVDKTALAMQIATDLRRAGADVKRLFGPLSVYREDGRPECRYHTVAKPLVEGGQSLKLLFCERRGGTRCEQYDSCLARRGVDGPDDARIAVGPHALLTKLQAEAGTTGLLVIDEPPALLETLTFTLKQLDAALAARSMFEVRYAAAMTPALRALRHWTAETAELERVVDPKDAVRSGVSAIDAMDIASACIAVDVERSGDIATDALACVRSAISDTARSTAPPIQLAQMHTARRSPSLAENLGAASKVLNALRFVLTTEERVAARVEERGSERALVLTHARTDLADAVRRVGATVVLDANADLHALVLEKVVGYAPPSHRFHAPDGAPIERTLLRTGSATRTSWLFQRRMVVSPQVLALLRRVLEWASADGDARSLGLVTFRPLAIAIQLARAPDDPTLRAAWSIVGRGRHEVMCKQLAATLAKWTGDLRVGHYGAVRGLDSMKEVDCLATLGDPWPNLGVVQHDVEFLGLTETWKKRTEAMCRAELEQAHGRLRVVHRTRPARALHVGNMLPGGSGWAEGRVEMVRRSAGRPRNEAAMTCEEVRAAVDALGGLRKTAAKAECALATIVRYANGERATPAAMAVVLQELVAHETGEERRAG